MSQMIMILCTLTLLTSGCAHSQPKAEEKTVEKIKSSGMTLQAKTLVDGDDVIWGFDFLPGERILFGEREGKLYILDKKKKTITPVKGAPQVVARGQGGLLDIAVLQKAASTWVYLTYSAKKKGGNTTVLSRAKLNNNALTEFKEIFQASPNFGTTHHFGSRVVFDGKGHLFVSIGDRGKRDLAQSLETHNGKILRLNEDGSLPKGNPFAKNKKALPEIWSYGHRNIQGLFFDKSTNTLWSQEHGPRGGDEINKIKKGANYGWPIITYGREYYGPKIGDGITEKKGMEQPYKYYVPSIAPSGLIVYSGKLFKSWKGNLFSGALADRHLNRLYYNKGKLTEERILSDFSKRIRNVKEAADGKIYVSTDSGHILELSLDN